MQHTDILFWCTALTSTLVGAAIITDLRWRRIPNYLTLPAFLLAIAIRIALQGWGGLGLAIAGAVLSPCLLLLFHGGRGLGMGDLKLAAALGAIAGPVLGATMMLVTAIVGGFQAIILMLGPGGLLRKFLGTFLIGFPSKQRNTSRDTSSVNESPKVTTMPYGVALGIGSLLTLAVCWWTGQEDWIISFVKIAVNP